jgi:DNA-directed RNA polymerase subunit RPC12/RpoP
MVAYVCRHCGSPDIDAEERTPRYIAVEIAGFDDDGDLRWAYDPTNRDEAVWEASETIGFRCASCGNATDNLPDLIRIETLLSGT